VCDNPILPGGPFASKTSYATGDTFFETPGEYMEVGNASSADARVMATAMLPKGAPLSVNQDGASIDVYPSLTDSVGRPHGPMTVNRSSIEVDRPAGAFELVQILLDFNPGVSTPRHMHGGQELAMVTTGEMTLQRSGNVELIGAGEAWVNAAGLIHAAGNDGADFAQVVATFLLPAGRPLTTVV
jgi:quercetin dioxygenase-like cupin family protein